jgi:hypothetical protein
VDVEVAEDAEVIPRRMVARSPHTRAVRFIVLVSSWVSCLGEVVVLHA